MKVIVDELAIEYETAGTGPVVLFLHGWQDNHETFNPLIPLLLDSYQVVRVDLPGFGKSETPKDVWDLENYVNFVSHFIQKLNLGIYAFIGHSFGGRIIIKGMASEVLSAPRVILIGSAGIAKRKTLRNLIFRTIAKVGKAVSNIPPLNFWKEDLRKKLYRVAGGDYLKAGSLQQTFVKIISEDLAEDATKMRTRALLIWGANDTETPLADGKRLSLLIPEAMIKVVENAGHYVHKDKKEEVVEIIKKFLLA